MTSPQGFIVTNTLAVMNWQSTQAVTKCSSNKVQYGVVDPSPSDVLESGSNNYLLFVT